MKEGTHMQEKMIVLSMDAMVREDVAYLELSLIHI